MTPPFQALVVEALNLMHPRFAAAHGREYTPTEAEDPPASRKTRERSFVMEFYHEFRRMWDKAIPVQRGLGHILVQGDPDAPRQPDLLFWQLGEHGAPDRRFGAVSLVFRSNPAAVAADLKLLARFHSDLGYPHAFCVLIGKATDANPDPVPGVTIIHFDTEKWQVVG
ncbi:MAG: hypothetical protein C0467_04550 [Planctomycetaceae bacterium]|nr:hypothetical protein [Planctomycetaceae bacterium]